MSILRKPTRISLFLAFAALFATVPAFARECTPVRLDKASPNGRPEEDGTLANIPIMDQDSTLTCFCYTAAQMADAYRFSNPDTDRKHITSPVAACIDYAKVKGFDNLDKGGSLGATLSQIFKSGSCSYEKVGDRFGAYDLKGFLQGLRAYFDGIRGENSDEIAATVDLACYLNDRNFLPFNFNVAALEEALRKNTFMEFVHTSLAQVCNKNTKRIHKTPEIKAYQAPDYASATERKRAFLEKMDEVNSPRSLPKGIYLCQDMVTDRQNKGISRSGEPTEECGILHTMLLAGRRKTASGGCEVLLRNSWGASCNGYPWPCERGQIWVSEEALLNNMYGLVDYK